ncbi:MAG: hypothetical protein JNJ54_33570 [Myxococcaceae bacterium]|nr:hypothetical protein [Myxococcaceae bacterium]
MTAGDPFGLKAGSFSVRGSLLTGVTLAARDAGPILGVCLAFAIPAGALQVLVPGDDLRSMGQSARLSNLFEVLVGIIGSQALVARLIARAEGRRLSLGQAFSVSLRTWSRCFGARFRAGLAILAFTLLLIVPGVWKYVQLVFVTTAVLRSTGDPLALSQHLVSGRWWPVFGLSLLIGVACFTPAFVGVALFAVALELVHSPPVIGEILGEWVFGVAQVIGSSVTLVAFYGLHRDTGTPLGPLPFAAGHRTDELAGT